MSLLILGERPLTGQRSHERRMGWGSAEGPHGRPRNIPRSLATLRSKQTISIEVGIEAR